MIKTAKKIHGNAGKNNPMYGRKPWWVTQGKPHPMTGRKHSKESKEKMRQSTIGQKAWNKGRHGKSGGYCFQRNQAYRVWEGFWGEKPVPGYDIHHIDKDRNNNHITNLAMLTRSTHRCIHNKER